MEDFDRYRFDVVLLQDAVEFLSGLEEKTREKVLENIRVSRFKNDPRLLKKVDKEIWEFRSRYNKQQIRLLAFWDKQSKSLIVCTHGFVKKDQQLPAKELRRAKNLRTNYLTSKYK